MNTIAMNCRASRLRILALSCIALPLSSIAYGQAAETVLFGEQDTAGLALPAERRAVHPLTSPYYNEDSFVTTDIRAWYVRHEFPNTIALAGGSATVYAVQARAALTESIQFVAYKDGFLDLNTGLLDESGLNDVAAGFKWAFLQDWESDTHAAAGVGYELGIGDDDVLQDDDEVRIWGSFNKGFDRLHLGGNVNLTFPVGDEDALGDSDRLSWHLHADYFVNETFSPVLEVNGYSTLSEGDNAPLPFSGVDVANLGGGDGEDVITAGIGAEIRAADIGAFRIAHEQPLTDNEDLFGYRWTVSFIFGF